MANENLLIKIILFIPFLIMICRPKKIHEEVEEISYPSRWGYVAQKKKVGEDIATRKTNQSNVTMIPIFQIYNKIRTHFRYLSCCWRDQSDGRVIPFLYKVTKSNGATLRELKLNAGRRVQTYNMCCVSTSDIKILFILHKCVLVILKTKHLV